MRNSIYWLQYSCMWPIKLQPWTWALLSIQHKPPSSLASTTDILFQLVSLLLFLPTPLHPHTHSIPHIMLNPAARVILLKQKSNQVTGGWMVFNYPLDKIWITGGAWWDTSDFISYFFVLLLLHLSAKLPVHSHPGGLFNTIFYTVHHSSLCCSVTSFQTLNLKVPPPISF